MGTEAIMEMPVLFVGHGSPMNAIEENAYTRALVGLREKLPRPKAVCVVSAHWVTDGTEVLTVALPKTIHDFYGFPRALYEVEYPAPGAPQEAARVANELELKPDETWGLDHGAWSVLRHLYPQADVPVFQVSLDQRRSLRDHLALGGELKSLRQRGVLILGSGNLVHNLRRVQPAVDAQPFDWTREFDAKVTQAIEVRDVHSMAAPTTWGESLLATAHPTLEHYVPLLYCMGSTSGKDVVSYPHEGFDYGSISMRMVLFEERAS